MDDSFWKHIANWLWAVFIPLIYALWNTMTGRMKEMKEELSTKAPNEELIRVRNTQIDIYKQLQDHDAQDRNRHEQVLTSLGRLEGKMDALLNRKREGT